MYLSKTMFPKTWNYLYGEYLSKVKDFFNQNTRVRTGALRASVTLRVSSRGYIVIDAMYYWRWVAMNYQPTDYRSSTGLSGMAENFLKARQLVLFPDTIERLQELLAQDFNDYFGDMSEDNLDIISKEVSSHLIPYFLYVKDMTLDDLAKKGVSL